MTRFALGAKCGRPASPPCTVHAARRSLPEQAGQRRQADARGAAAEEMPAGQLQPRSWFHVYSFVTVSSRFSIRLATAV